MHRFVIRSNGDKAMNWTQIEGKWQQLKGDVKSRWGKLTDDDLQVIAGKFDGLVGKVVERYGIKKEQARDQVSVWADRLKDRMDAVGRRPPIKTPIPGEDVVRDPRRF
jgi:uncharacterized protein YjbJ (UPF0337 family)